MKTEPQTTVIRRAILNELIRQNDAGSLSHLARTSSDNRSGDVAIIRLLGAEHIALDGNIDLGRLVDAIVTSCNRVSSNA